MWGALVKQVLAYVLTRKGKKVFAFAGAMLLCFMTALLLDWQLYLSASFTGVLALASVIAFFTQRLRQRQDEHERQRRNQTRAETRAATAEARSERIRKAKGAVGQAARGVSDAAFNAAGATHRAFRSARERMRIVRRRKMSEADEPRDK